MSPMVASASGMMPPAPIPWNARKAASSYIDWARPHSADPITKIPIDAMSRRLRPKMSDSLPNSGVAIVEVIRNAVVTQACADRPFKSLPMVLMAVATIVWSSDARNMPSISPDKMVRICR